MSLGYNSKGRYTLVACILMALALIIFKSNHAIVASQYKSLDQTLPQRLNKNHSYKFSDCGRCHTDWSTTINSLRKSSIDSIKQAHGLVESLITNSTVYRGIGNDSARLSTSGGPDSIIGLEEKFSFIGQQVLINKQNSDKLNLLRGELGAALNSSASTKADLKRQASSYEKLTNKIGSLSERLETQTTYIQGLYEVALDRFYSRVAIARLKSLRNLKKLIISQLKRSRSFLDESLKIQHKLYSDNALEKSNPLVGASANSRSLYDTINGKDIDTGANDTNNCKSSSRNHNFYRELLNLAQQLHKSISEVSDLDEQFRRNRRLFIEHEKLILTLHNEVDSIMESALKRINTLRHCRLH